VRGDKIFGKLKNYSLPQVKGVKLYKLIPKHLNLENREKK
jgi:hypothetical protein